MEKMYGLSFSHQSDGAICLSQNDVAEESSVVLSPEQLRYIARRVAGLDESDSARVADLERKLGVLASRIEKIACDDNLRNDIAEHCRDGLWILSQLDGLLDLAVEFDGGRLLSGLRFAPKPEEINSELN